MSALTVLDFGGKNIRFKRRGDRVWVSLTDMAKATDKRVNNWTQLSSTREFLTELAGSTGITVDKILTSNESHGNNESRGTWAVEEVAIDFAAWCNVKFRVWVNQQIKTLMTEGTVSIAPTLRDPPRTLPAPPTFEVLLKGLELLPTVASPIVKAALEQRLAEELGANGTSHAEVDKPVLVAVLARSMGYSFKPGQDAKLGSFVAKRHQSLGKAQHGRYECNTYSRTDALETTIHEFFTP